MHEKTSLKISLMDPGHRNIGGHHYDWNTAICHTLKAEGHDIDVYASQHASDEAKAGFPSGVTVHRHFRFNPYMKADFIDPISGPLELQYMGLQSVTEDLLKTPPADIWIWPTLFPHQLAACAKAQTKASISGCIHHPPGENAGWWRMGTNWCTKAGVDIRAIGTSTQDNLANFHGILGELHPQAFPEPFKGRPTAKRANDTVGIFGATRKEQGSQYLIPIIQHCLNHGLKVLTHDSELIPKRLKDHPGLIIAAFEPDFSRVIERCNLVIAPYLWTSYKSRASGIVSQARASGIPCVIPAGTGFSQDMEKEKCATLFYQHTSEAILCAIDLAISNYPDLAAAAQTAALKWEKINGPRRFASVLIHGHENTRKS
ncbi:MAG: hypothetical protein V7711_01175 [Pseudomonadales bacterium]